jgi:sulfatase maturation enzyme AslB (radical SAM superfamily)
MEYTISLNNLKRTLKKQEDELPMFSRTPESWSKFTVDDNGTVFYYSNYDNGLYDENKNPLTKVAEADDDYIEVVSETRSRTKSNKPYWIRILLGHACNYSCSYCMQKDIGNPGERSKITTTD